MSFFDDELNIPDVPDTPEVPAAPDVPTETPAAPDAPSGTPNAPEVPGTPAPAGSASDMPDLPNMPSAPSPNIAQAVADLNDNSDLDAVKGGPGATASTRDVGGESKTAKLAQETINGQPNMSPAPGAPAPYKPADFLGGEKTAGTASGGIINSALDWAKKNPQLAAALVTTTAGALGGAGKAALDKSTMEKKSQLELANAEDLFAYKQEQSRNFSASGTLAQPNLTQPGIINGGLRRPGGAQVFGPNGRLAR